MLSLQIGYRTDPGRKRDHNEDAVGVWHPRDPTVRRRKGSLFVVADGLGGHLAGEVASRQAVDTFIGSYRENPDPNIPACLVQAVQRANAEVYTRGQALSRRARMATTLVGAVVRGRELHVVNVGDSRAYLLRHGTFTQLTQDHTFVAMAAERGVQLSTSDSQRLRSVITRALGSKPAVEVDYFAHTFQPGDVLVLCSDGLTRPVREDEISDIVRAHPPQEAAERLVDLANERGGPDNISVIVVKALSTAPHPPPWLKRLPRWMLFIVPLVLLTLMLTCLGLVLLLGQVNLPSTAPRVAPVLFIARQNETPDSLARHFGYPSSEPVKRLLASQGLPEAMPAGQAVTIPPARPGLYLVGKVEDFYQKGSSGEARFRLPMGDKTYQIICPPQGKFRPAYRLHDGSLVTVFAYPPMKPQRRGWNDVNELVAEFVDVQEFVLFGLYALPWHNWYHRDFPRELVWVYTVLNEYTVEPASIGGKANEQALIRGIWTFQKDAFILEVREAYILKGKNYQLIRGRPESLPTLPPPTSTPRVPEPTLTPGR